jgi:hypothetical protein
MCMRKDEGKLGHVFVEMARELGQNCGGEGLRIGPSLWIEGGSGSNVNVRGWRVGEGDIESALAPSNQPAKGAGAWISSLDKG